MNPKRISTISGIKKTSLKKSGNKLLSEFELSESVINQLPGIFYLYDGFGNFIKWNKNFESVTGYKAAEIRRMKPIDFYDKAQQAIIKKRISTVFKKKDVPGIEIELLSKQKKKVPFYINSKAVTYKGIRCLMGIGTDISKLKQTEQQLVENHAVLNAILESTHSSVFSLDLQYRYTSFNKAHVSKMKEIYGAKIEIGKSIFEYQSVKDDNDHARRNIKKAFKGQQFVEHEYLGEPGLKRIYFEISHNPIFNVHGKVIGVSIYSTDITDRKQAEDALIKSEERYRLLIESANEGILVAQDHYLKFINKRVSEFMGYSEKKLLSTPFLQFIHPDSHELIINMYRKRMLGEPVPKSYQLRIIHKDRSSRWVEFSGVKIDWKGEPAVMNFITDVTESRKISNDLVKINRLYAFISNCNDLILRANDREKLFAEICQIAVTDGKFRMSWIGKLDETTLNVEPLAWAGYEDGYLKKIKKINLRNTPESNGPTGESLKKGKTFFCNDIANDPRMKPWKQDALKRGYYSSISIPIKVQNKLYGAFTLYADETNSFSPEEVDLLEKITGNISFSLEKMLIEEERKMAVEELERSRLLLNSSIESQKETILFSIDKKYQYILFNKAHQDMMKFAYNKDIAIGMKILDCITLDDDRKNAKKNYDRAFKGESHSNIQKYGDTHVAYFESFFNPILNNKNQVIGATGLARDISERKKLELEREQFLKFFLLSNDIMVIADLDGCFKKVNPSCLQVLGYSEMELLNKPFLEFVYPGDQNSTIEEIQRQKKLGFSIKFENRYICKDGSVKCLSWQSNYNLEEELSYSTARDVTLSKQMIEELRFSENRYKTLFEKASDGILIMDATGKIVSLNESFASMHGYTVKELLQMNLRKLDTPEMAKQLPKKIARVMGGEHINIEVDHFHKDGHIITLAVSSSLIHVGNEDYIQAFHTDITQRRQTEKKIRQLSMAVEQSSASIVITDIKGNIEYVNSKFVELTGYSFDEAIGKNPRILKSGHTSKEGYKALWDSISNGKSWHGKLHNKKKNGDLYWESASISPIFDEYGVITHFLAIKEDISEQKKAEETLLKYSSELETTNKLMKETLERFELVNRATEDVIWEWDLEKDQIIRSESFAKKYGYPAKQIKNDRAWAQNRLHPLDRDRVNGIIDHCLKNRLTNWQDEYRFLSGDGTYKYVYDRGFILFDESGNPRRMIGAMSDLTEKVNLQSALEVQEIRLQKQLLQVNILAHEEEKNVLGLELHDNIVQMLATVKLYLGMIKSGFGTPEDDLIGKSYQHLNVTLDELRKLSHSLVSPSLRDMDLEEALQELLREASLGKNININLSVDKAFNKSKIDKAKELMLYRIIQEQINNIFKYANARKVFIAIKIEGSNLALTVVDNGVGFDINKKASGIGLRNIKTRVEYYNGSMNIISKPGAGCTLEVRVPIISEYE